MSNFFITASSAIFVFGLLIFIHEFGHFILAKHYGVKVLEFALGMGPVLLRFQGKETDYSLRLFPIGGFVRMLGEGEYSHDSRALCNLNPWKRIPIIAAGAVMNLVLALILFSLVSYKLGFVKPIVSSVSPRTPAELAGIKENDKIISISGKKIRTYSDFLVFTHEYQDKEFEMNVQRDNSIKTFLIKPVKDEKTKQYVIGIRMTPVRNANLASAIHNGFLETSSSVKLMLYQLKILFAGKVSLNDIGGPVAIVKMSGEAAKRGIWNLLWFAGFISINLGVVNLIPFPALDGGTIILCLIEGIAGRKLNEERIGSMYYIGFLLLITLMILITFKDIIFIFFRSA